MQTLPPPSRVAVATADSSAVAPTAPSGDVATLANNLSDTIEAVIAGKSDAVEIAVATMLAGGHLLIEDIPGVGKTLLAQSMARAIGGSFRRIQGTSDLLPSDITGSMVPSGVGSGADLADTLRFRPGPVFANLVVFDELNRATPRTQSALLELAEESTVTIDGTSHPLPRPFMLVATQNPIDVAGTYGLGEGALDRFHAVVTPGRPGADAELEVLTGRRGRSMLDGVAVVADVDQIEAARVAVAAVHVADPIARYVVDLLRATREHPRIRLGASTRGGVALIALGRALAAMSGRGYVTPDDISRACVPALAHRVIGPNTSVAAGRELIETCLADVAAPRV